MLNNCIPIVGPNRTFVSASTAAQTIVVPDVFEIGERFDVARPGYNPSGDKSMDRMIINAVFGNENIT